MPDLDSLDRIALVGNFLPRKCGIATYTTDTYNALTARYPDLAIDVWAMDDRPEGYDYPPAVTGSIAQNERAAYLAVAREIEASGAQVLWLQHEFGIFGGAAGEHILALLDRVTMPVVVTLHTVLAQPNPDQRRVTEALLRRAARVIVMAERGRDTLVKVYGARPASVAVIPHGVPDRDFIEPDDFKDRFGWHGRKVVLTFGLLSPDKGIETMIAALPAVAAHHPDLLYVVLGATHPHLVKHEGEAYRERLQAQAAELGVGDHVAFINEFVETDSLVERLQAADVYVTPYRNPEQSTSGALSYAIGVGKAVVSTPYVHATEILSDGHGVLVDFGDSAGFAREVDGLLSSERNRVALSRRAYARGRTMIWPRYAEAAVTTLQAARATRTIRLQRATRLPPLAPNFTAVERMSDRTGIIQHSILSVPDRRHGYCIDDNARAMMLVTQIPDLDPDLRDKWMTIYGAFVQYAWNPDQRRFRNFMRYDRSWCEDCGSEDSNGRALWSLGVTARDAYEPKHRHWAGSLFDETASLAFELGSPRAWAFAMLGATAMMDAHPGHEPSRSILTRFGDELVALVDTAQRPDWKWFEIVLAYDNARLPEALIRAGLALDRQDFVRVGLDTLGWIVGQTTSSDGRYRPVGSDSFGREYEAPLPFDQQPLEAVATIDACAAAFAATGEQRWLDEANRAYRWFLGANDLDLPLASGEDGGCFDGLMPGGLNRNQGAESILALQSASCAILALSKAAGTVATGERAVA